MLNNIFKNRSHKAVYIAEIGLNHNGDINMAKDMIRDAAGAGAHAVKFQTFIPEKMNSLYTKSLLGKGIEDDKDSSVIDFLSKFVFTREQYVELKSCADKYGVIFFSSPFDFESVELLESIHVPMYKIASSEVTNHPLIKKIAETGKPAILSTGMSTEEEISMAVDLFNKNSGAELLLMHCVSLYPPQPENVNLERISALKQKFNINIGFSDHTRNIEASFLSTCFGVRIFERHFTIDAEYDCPDRAVSLTPGEFSLLIESVENAISMLGNGSIDYSEDETSTAEAARRSLFARRFIPSGKVIERDDLIGLRPGFGIPLYNLDSICGMVSNINIAKDSLIREEYLDKGVKK